MTNKTHVVILGGGIGGMEAAIPLARREDVTVTVIDRNACHIWKPALHEFAAGTMPHQGNTFAFDALGKRFGFDFIQAEPETVDRETRTIGLSNGQSLTYDYLIVSVGARINDFGTPGVAEHCLVLDSYPDAGIMHERFSILVQEARKTGEPVDIGIIGGGATGVQLAAEFCDALDKSPEFGKDLRKKLLRPVVIEAAPRLIPAFPENVSIEAKAELEAIGVRVMVNEKVNAVDEKGIHLASGRQLAMKMSVWAAGVQGSRATGIFEGLEIARSAQLMVRPDLQTTRDPRIIALGDCARLEKDPVPPTAQVARQQGRYVGRVCLPDLLAGLLPPAFVFHNRGAVVALGDYNAWGMWPSKQPFGGRGLGACFAHLIHEGLYRQHQFDINGIGCAVNAVLQRLFSRPDPDLTPGKDRS